MKNAVKAGFTGSGAALAVEQVSTMPRRSHSIDETGDLRGVMAMAVCLAIKLHPLQKHLKGVIWEFIL